MAHDDRTTAAFDGAMACAIDRPHAFPRCAGNSSVVLDRDGKPHKLSREHKPEDPKEARRIKQHGGRLIKHVRHE